MDDSRLSQGPHSQAIPCSQFKLDGPPCQKRMAQPGDIFPEAMRALRSRSKEPEGRVEKGCSIRYGKNWDEVLGILRSVRDSYNKNTGVVGALKKAGRKISDNTDQINQVIWLVPDTNITSPLLRVLNLLIEVGPIELHYVQNINLIGAQAAKRTSKVRQDLEDGLEGISKAFTNIETYLTIFSEEDSIVYAAVKLSVSILEAIEKVIGYYTQNTGRSK